MTEWDAGGQGIYGAIDIIYRGMTRGGIFLLLLRIGNMADSKTSHARFQNVNSQ